MMRLSDEKSTILATRGRVAVRAGPGSGKTLLMAKRLANALSDWPTRTGGVAVMSFTNVAHEEIQRQARVDFGVADPLPYPHFLGTIDSFVNSYIFLPFGHLAMKCGKRPELVGPPHGWFPRGWQWSWGKSNGMCYQKDCKLEDFSYDVDGILDNLKSKSVFRNCAFNHSACRRLKFEFKQRGYATQPDANYFAMKVLQNYPTIAKALVKRFPVLLVDEAQDSSETQMRIIELLADSGLSEVMMIGDPDQSIYEWRTARPELFQKKCSEWSPGLPALKENWRSSQVICDFAYPISSLPHRQLAMRDDVKDLDLGPKVWPYAADGIGGVVERFRRLCRTNGVDVSSGDVAIVSRASDLVSIIKKGRAAPIPPNRRRRPSAWSDTLPEAREIALSSFLFAHGAYATAIRRLMRAICSLEVESGAVNAEAIQDFVRRRGFVSTRIALYKLLRRLPKASGLLGDWCTSASSILADFCKDFLGCQEDVRLGLKRSPGAWKQYYESLDFMDEFAGELGELQTSGPQIGTVHSVKGKTVEALLLVLKTKGGSSPFYSKLLSERVANRAGDMHEELRILYVAMTRPRRLLVIAVPRSEIGKWQGVLPQYVQACDREDVSES